MCLADVQAPGGGHARNRILRLAGLAGEVSHGIAVRSNVWFRLGVEWGRGVNQSVWGVSVVVSPVRRMSRPRSSSVAPS